MPCDGYQSITSVLKVFEITTGAYELTQGGRHESRTISATVPAAFA